MSLALFSMPRPELQLYDQDWIRARLAEIIDASGQNVGVSDMTTGPSLWFCQLLLDRSIPYLACLNPHAQEEISEEWNRIYREQLIQKAAGIKRVDSSWMSGFARAAILVWDGRRGKTFDVFESWMRDAKKKPVWWVSPYRRKVVEL